MAIVEGVAILMPEERDGGLEISLPGSPSNDDQVWFWASEQLGAGLLLWIEGGYMARRVTHFVRVSIYISETMYQESIVRLVMGDPGMINEILAVAEAAATAWKFVWFGFIDAEIDIRLRGGKDFNFPTNPIRVVFPHFIIQEAFGGKGRIEKAVRAVEMARGMGFVGRMRESIYEMFLRVDLALNEGTVRAVAATLRNHEMR